MASRHLGSFAGVFLFGDWGGMKIEKCRESGGPFFSILLLQCGPVCSSENIQRWAPQAPAGTRGGIGSDGICSWCFSPVFSVGVPYKSLLCVPVIFRCFVINWPQKSTQKIWPNGELQCCFPEAMERQRKQEALEAEQERKRWGHSITGGFWWMVSGEFQGFFRGFFVFFWMKIDDFDQMEVEVVEWLHVDLESWDKKKVSFVISKTVRWAFSFSGKRKSARDAKLRSRRIEIPIIFQPRENDSPGVHWLFWRQWDAHCQFVTTVIII